MKLRGMQLLSVSQITAKVGSLMQIVVGSNNCYTPQITKQFYSLQYMLYFLRV